LGLLLIGAGLCTGVFCALAFRQAASNPQSEVHITVPYYDKADPFGKEQTTVKTQLVPDLEPMVRAYQLLSASLGLSLGGLSLWLASRGRTC
jgi:hypothetical protein